MLFRTARHTNNLEKIVAFYTTILNFEVLGHFENHDHYDGVFIGRKDMAWHLEFTTSKDKAHHIFDEDDILVFYPQTRADYDDIMHRIRQQGIPVVRSKNPFWNTNGKMIKDPDGYSIIISDLEINKHDDSMQGTGT